MKIRFDVIARRTGGAVIAKAMGAIFASIA